MIQASENRSVPNRPADVFSIIQLILAGMTALFLALAGIVFTIWGIAKMDLSAPSEIILNAFFSAGVLLFFVAITLIPFLIRKYTALHGPVLEKDLLPVRTARRIFPAISLGLWVAIMISGRSLDWKGGPSSLLTPIFSILAILLPLLFFISILNPPGSSFRSSRAWGSVNVGTILPPLLSGLVEIFFLALLLLAVMMIKIQEPSFITNLELTVIRLSNAESNPEVANHLIVSILRNPSTRILVYLSLAGFIPMVEEAFKQIPVWLLAWRKLTPQDGFRVGALSGLGFALTEGLLNSISIEDYRQFIIEMILRSEAGLIHIVAGAICGWGLASAFSNKKYMRGILGYLAAIAIHGTWNALAIWESTIRVMKGIVEPSWQYYLTNGTQALLLTGFFIIMFCFWIMHNKILKE